MVLIAPNRLRRTLALGLLAGALILPQGSFSRGLDKAEIQSLVVLEPEDAIPTDVVKLEDLSLGGNKNGEGCARYELLLQAKALAVEAGANILKIRKRTSHSQRQRCDGLEVTFYQSADPQRAEKTFSWNPSRKLSWNDFTGPVRNGCGDGTVAETSCGIAIETNLAPSSGRARVYVFNTFDKQTSWVRAGKDQPAVLEHEQGHWDICELYTRRMQARFDEEEISGATLNRKVTQIYNAVTREYMERQEQYERETQHGVVPDAQQRWTKMLAEELQGI